MDDCTPKRCVRCGVDKSRSEFHKRAKASDGLNAACKACLLAERRAYREKNRDRLNQESREWRAANPGRQAELSRLWREANPEVVKLYRRAWDAAHVEERRASKRAWYEANREWVLTWPERNPESSAARFQRYREAHRDARAEAQRRRRVDKFGGVIEDVDLPALWTGSCGICAGVMDEQLRWPHPMSKSIDHIIPLSQGGTHQAENLQWAHLRCNISKGARMPDSA